MIEEKGIVYTDPKIPVKEPLKLCIDCKNYALNSSKGICHECLVSTSKAIHWEQSFKGKVRETWK